MRPALGCNPGKGGHFGKLDKARERKFCHKEGKRIKTVQVCSMTQDLKLIFAFDTPIKGPLGFIGQFFYSVTILIPEL